MVQLKKYLKIISEKFRNDDLRKDDFLRHDFKERYHAFKLLLTANNSLLEIFAQIDKLLFGNQPFGMSAVKASSTAALVNAFQMIRKLDRLSPGKYKTLLNRFDSIKNEINTLLNQTKTTTDKRLVMELSEIDNTVFNSVGQKIANLGDMKNILRLDVPDGFVFTACAFESFFKHNDLQTEIYRLFKIHFSNDVKQSHLLSSKIQQIIINAKIPLDLKIAVEKAIKKLKVDNNNKKNTLALRSSSLMEDMVNTSFAGQYKSLLNVSIENIFQAYKEVIAGKYSTTAIQYRLNRGIKDEDTAMCVGCLLMVDAVAGGVAYSRNPFKSHDDSIFIQSTWGLPKSIVDGSGNCDLFIVSGKPELHLICKNIQKKDKKFTCYREEGVYQTNVTENLQSLPSLGEKNVIKLAKLTKKIESYYGIPQDIEWAFVDGDPSIIYILQCRPLKQTVKKEKKRQISAFDREACLIAENGIMACSGVAFGSAYVVEKDADLLKFPEGAILVTRLARPEWASLLGMASAVITEQGGFAGHLANVAREFNVPALFSVKDICKKVKTGEIITVDADALSVYRGKIESLLGSKSEKKNLMKDTPVYNVLEKINQYITPLNLLDPDSTEFRSQNCQTLHDITRFIHEKSVYEMFNFGRTHGFDEMSSKQLHHDVPMQWRVLNLDDGFNKEIKGKYVYLDDIASAPMLAIWEGIVAVPWDGPPPVDKRGLISVMFQATANPALNTGIRSKYSTRNYFMISSQYCSLSSRLGFHFSTLEAYIGNSVSENYISFRFQGGAADHMRRLKRVKLIGDFLLHFGFNIKIRKDNLNARLKGFDKKYILERLKIIGYLTIHTRQLDMISSDNVLVSKYLNKFKKDIKSVLKIKTVQVPETSQQIRKKIYEK